MFVCDCVCVHVCVHEWQAACLNSRENEGCVPWNMDEGKRWNSITLKISLSEHFYEDKNDASMQMLIFMFFIYISQMFPTISIYLLLTLTNWSAERAPSSPTTKWKCIIAMLRLRPRENTEQKCSYWQIHHAIWAVQTPDFIILLISSSFLWIICRLLSSSALSSPLDVVKPIKNLQAGSVPVFQSKSGASSSSPSLLSELFTSYWCGGWPAVFLVNYSCLLPSPSKGLTLWIYSDFICCALNVHCNIITFDCYRSAAAKTTLASTIIVLSRDTLHANTHWGWLTNSVCVINSCLYQASNL